MNKSHLLIKHMKLTNLLIYRERLKQALKKSFWPVIGEKGRTPIKNF